MPKTDDSTLALDYDRDSRRLTIVTPGGTRIVIHDADDAIAVEDRHGNRARFDAAGIGLESAGTVRIHAKGDLSLSAGGKIDLAAQGDVKASGLNLTLNAQAGLSAKGAASAELSAAGQTVVKGAMVLIN